MADGMSGLRVLDALLWDTERDPNAVEPAPHTPTPSYTGRALFRFGLAARVRASSRRGVRPDWRQVPREGRRLMAALRREVLPGSDLSPMAARVGASRTVGWLSGPLAELHDAGK